MNNDSNLIFEAYKKQLTESTLIPTEEEIQDAITDLNSKCNVGDVKSVIEDTIQGYRATTEEILKDGLYEDLRDVTNHSPMGGGKPRLNINEIETAKLAVMLANQLRLNKQMRERNERGENAEEKTEKLTVNDVNRAVQKAFKTSGEASRMYPDIIGMYSGAIYNILSEMGYNYFDSEVQKVVDTYESYCLQAHEEYSEDYSDRGPTLTQANDPETGILWYNWGGESFYNKAAINAAFELAHKEGINRVVINGLS